MSDTEKVNEFMKKLNHPLKGEMEAVRAIIVNANKKIAEHIKWGAPSFYYKDDLITLGPRTKSSVHMVFHNVGRFGIKSSILEGDHKDRRMAYLHSMEEVKANKKELEKIVNELVKAMDND